VTIPATVRCARLLLVASRRRHLKLGLLHGLASGVDVLSLVSEGQNFGDGLFDGVEAKFHLVQMDTVVEGLAGDLRLRRLTGNNQRVVDSRPIFLDRPFNLGREIVLEDRPVRDHLLALFQGPERYLISLLDPESLTNVASQAGQIDVVLGEAHGAEVSHPRDQTTTTVTGLRINDVDQQTTKQTRVAMLFGVHHALNGVLVDAEVKTGQTRTNVILVLLDKLLGP